MLSRPSNHRLDTSVFPTLCLSLANQQKHKQANLTSKIGTLGQSGSALMVSVSGKQINVTKSDSPRVAAAAAAAFARVLVGSQICRYPYRLGNRKESLSLTAMTEFDQQGRQTSKTGLNS